MQIKRVPIKFIDLNQVKYLIKMNSGNKFNEFFSKVLQINNYYDSVQKWVKHFRKSSITNKQINTQQNTKILQNSSINSHSIVKSNLITKLQAQNKQIQFFFNKYLQSIKPIINNFTQLTKNLNQQTHGFYSEKLQSCQIRQLLQIYQPLRRFKILSKNDVESQQKFQICQQKQLNSFSDINQNGQIFIMNLNSPPQNEQIKYWSHTIPIQKFQIQGPVIKGKGLGKQQLGMPTANIKIQQQLNQKLIQYPIGIYVTVIKMQQQNKIYLGAASLATNPHYQNLQSTRILQIYILNDFNDECFYDKVLKVKFHELIRFQFKFKDFSSFLNGMRNDIQITKRFEHLLKQTI